MRGAALATTAVLAMAAGCGGGSPSPAPPPDQQQVRTTLRSFLTAQVHGEGAAACRLLDDAARRRLAAVVRRTAGIAGSTCEDAVALVRAAAPGALLRALDAAQIRDVVVRGDRASAVVADAGAFPPQHVLLRRTGGTWQIDRVPTLLGG
ncbi:MAG TPA: hypothetical protein VFT50_08040 [Baekduia sp.]|nr:hypothetical protein [Baekduia sp.]